MSRIVKVVQGVHMACGHDGLRKVLKKEGIHLDKLEQGDLILCINGKGDKMKAIGFRGLVFGYLKMPQGNRIMFEALQYIPQTFGSGQMDYDAACRKALESRFRDYPREEFVKEKAKVSVSEKARLGKSVYETHA